MGHCLYGVFFARLLIVDKKIKTDQKKKKEEEEIIIITTRRRSKSDLVSARWDPGSCLPGGLWAYIHSFVPRRNKNYKEGEDNSNYGVCCDDISSYMQKCLISAHAV